MSADRGHALVKRLVVGAVIVVAAVTAWCLSGPRQQERAGSTSAETGTVEERPADVAPAANAEHVAVNAGSEPASSAAAAAEPSSVRLPRLLDLGATTCVPCKMMAPILDEMKETFAGKLTVEFIDVREDKEAVKRYGIQVIPTQIFFDPDGKELFRHQGFYSREDILTKWKELGYEFTG